MEDQINEIQQKFNQSLEVAKRENSDGMNDNESSPINQENTTNETMNNKTEENGSGNESKSSSFEEVTSGSSAQDVEMVSKPDTATNTNCNSNSENNESTQQMSQTQSSSNLDKNIYHIKWISYCGGQCGVITQNSNGPCPLISIVNCLSLRGKLALPKGTEVISAEQLLETLADLLISLEPGQSNQEQDFRHNMNDAIAILPKLQTGIDVNVRFTGVTEFEYTSECIVFDLVSIGLYHGWLVDPQMEDTVIAIGNMSYNQTVEFIISGRSSSDPLDQSKSLLAEQFLEESASQLTYHGICELNSVMKDGQLAVFFRNNHFSSMCKHQGVLYLLVTDQGFLDQADVVWETLDSVQGDTVFVDQHFNIVNQSQGGAVGPVSESTEVSDHQLAMSLQQQDQEASQRDQEWQQFKQSHLESGGEPVSDEELARRLQAVENAAAEQQSGQSSQAQPNNPIGPRNNRDKKCIIL